jgi:hypothetical protein
MPHPKRKRGMGKNERQKNQRKREGPFVMKAWSPHFKISGLIQTLCLLVEILGRFDT